MCSSCAAKAGGRAGLHSTVSAKELHTGLARCCGCLLRFRDLEELLRVRVGAFRLAARGMR